MVDRQLYFPFVREGAIQLYNDLLEDHLNNLYKIYFMGEKNYHYIKDKDVFCREWLRSDKHKEFARNTWDYASSQSVDKQNDEVWDRWIDNKLHDSNHKVYRTLDSVLNEYAIQQELFTNGKN